MLLAPIKSCAEVGSIQLDLASQQFVRHCDFIGQFFLDIRQILCYYFNIYFHLF